MKDALLIKSNPYGITLRFHPDMDFENLIEEVRCKFQASAHFFDHADMAVAYEGRTFTKDEEVRMTETIQEAAGIRILCILDRDKDTEQLHRRLVQDCLSNSSCCDGLFYRGTVKRRERLETETSVIIIGDVEEDAAVISKGNVVVTGTIYGSVTAGASGRMDVQIVANGMNPQKLRIGGIEVKPSIGGSYSWAKLL